MLCFGSAGALDPRLALGDLVIAQRAVVHHSGVFSGRRFEFVGVMGRDGQGRPGHRRAFEADPCLATLAVTTARSLDGQAYAGTVVTGDQVIFSTARKRWLRRTFDALAVDMETAAVAQVAEAHQVPWLAIRAISDAATDDLAVDYGRLGFYLDDDRPRWRRGASRWVYMLTHPRALRRVLGLRKGLALASMRAAQLVVAMLEA